MMPSLEILGKKMKYILVVGIVCILAVGTGSFIGASESHGVDSYLQTPMEVNPAERYVLVTLVGDSKIVLFNNAGNSIWQKTGITQPMDAELLDSGNVLITEPDAYKVTEVDPTGAVVWQKTGLNGPMDAERLDNGNTLIVDVDEGEVGRVIEVNTGGATVWEKGGLSGPFDAERLDNGNTLIALFNSNRVIEVDASGATVWQKTGLQMPTDAERLPNGNTLIADFMNYRVIEVNTGGTIVWQKGGLDGPMDAERLDNGNTLIADGFGNKVIEVNTGGTVVWQKTGLSGPYDAEGFFSGPPETPTIDGPLNGEIRVEYDYTVMTSDPDNNNIFYYVDWGDSTNSGWVGSSASGEEMIVTHKWTTQGDFLVRAELEVTMPVNQQTRHPLFQRFLERFPNAFPLLRHLLDR